MEYVSYLQPNICDIHSSNFVDNSVWDFNCYLTSVIYCICQRLESVNFNVICFMRRLKIVMIIIIKVNRESMPFFWKVNNPVACITLKSPIHNLYFFVARSTLIEIPVGTCFNTSYLQSTCYWSLYRLRRHLNPNFESNRKIYECMYCGME